MSCSYTIPPLLFVLYVLVNGQFSQHSYRVIHDRVDITDYNHSAVRDPQVTIFNYNSTSSVQVINASAYFLPGVYKNILIKIDVFRFVAKKYRSFPINVTLNGCDYDTFVKKDLFGTGVLINHSNFKGCPCPVGLYYLSNYVMDDSKLPPHLPLGKYKLHFHVRIDDVIYLVQADWYGSLVARQALG